MSLVSVSSVQETNVPVPKVSVPIVRCHSHSAAQHAQEKHTTEQHVMTCDDDVCKIFFVTRLRAISNAVFRDR